MKIEIDVSGQIVPATLADNGSARDFAAMLPLTLMLEDYANTEKVGDLPRKLDTGDAPDGFEPAAGAITHYAPWGNLAIFHKPFRHSAGLVELGRVDANFDIFRRPGAVRVTIRRAAD